ncbi:MAG: alpha/beta fold hydrolase [Chloroflexota bacterium]
MYFQEAGNSAHETILFLHGGDVAGWMWQPQLEAFQEQYHCLMPDLPGFGQSNQIPWQSFIDTAEQLADLIRERGRNGRSHIVGLSMGGHLALHLLQTAPDLVDKVVLSCTAVHPYPPKLRRMVRVVLPLMRFKLFWQAQAHLRRYPADAAQVYVETGLGIHQESLRRMMAEVMHSTRPKGLETFAHPVLLAAAELDQALIHESQKDLLDIFPNAQAVIAPKVHHGWSGENPDLFNRMLHAWLTDSPLPEELIPVKTLQTLSI